MKRVSGITLIALIITIIVLLILAGVALATLTGQGNIIGNAENAVGKYNNSVVQEGQLLNEIEKYLIEHTNGGEVEDTNTPIVTATEGEETITEGTNIDISSYFTYTTNGTAEITSVTYTDTSNGNVEVTNTNTLAVGTHIIKCTVTKETGATASATKTIIVKKREPVSAGEIASNPSEHYGGYVTNYTTPSGDPNVKWRIFYADEENIYLIASDYIHYNYAPQSKTYTLNKEFNSDYELTFSDVNKDYTGSADITDARLTKWLQKYLEVAPASTNSNIKSVAFMLDEPRWSEKYADESYAEYAIGGPTVEMFVASYNEVHLEKMMYCSVNSIGVFLGYYISWSEGGTDFSINGLDRSESLYVISDTEKANAMWIASPHAINVNTAYLMSVTNYGQLSYEPNGYRQSWIPSNNMSEIWNPIGENKC